MTMTQTPSQSIIVPFMNNYNN